tara:strand:- start:26435 stop:26872 length:438 start_codon:yes stop_codon:yes gene_type:complete
MVIGWSPGKNDIETGEPFSGPNGEVFDFFLEEAGIPRDQIYFTNVIKCHHLKLVDEYVVSTCHETWLNREMRFVNPSIIILVGEQTHTHITKGKREFAHASVNRRGGRAYFSIETPSHFLRSGMVDTFIGTADILKQLYDESNRA